MKYEEHQYTENTVKNKEYDNMKNKRKLEDYLISRLTTTISFKGLVERINKRISNLNKKTEYPFK